MWKKEMLPLTEKEKKSFKKQKFFYICKEEFNEEFKVVFHVPNKIFIICFIESPLKLMKNALYYILKTFFILKIFKFLSRLFGFGHKQKTAWLER